MQPTTIASETRAPYYVGVADLDALLDLWKSAESLGDYCDPLNFATTRQVHDAGAGTFVEKHYAVASWISPTGTCYIWSLQLCQICGWSGTTGPEPYDAHDAREKETRVLDVAARIEQHLCERKTRYLWPAASATPEDLLLLQANRPDFLAFDSELPAIVVAVVAS